MDEKKDKQTDSATGPSPAAIGGPVKSAFLYAFPSLNQRLQLLERLVSDGELLTLVVGEQASGKSMLLRYLLFHNRGRWKTCRIRSMEHTRNSASSKHIQNLSAYKLGKSRQYLLILDDAHHLGLEELQLLIRFAQKSLSNNIRISIVLLGEPQIRQMIDLVVDELPPTTAVSTLYMPALNEEQTKAYLQRRFLIEDRVRQIRFSDKQVRNIYQASEGLPGRINQEAKKVLNASQNILQMKKKEDSKKS